METNREGFAIPVALMVIGFLSISLMGAFTRVDNEFRVSTNRSKQVDAYALAETGLQRFVVTRGELGLTANPPIAAESARITLPGGFADVILQRVRPEIGNDPPLYLIRSRGTTTPPALAGMRPAQHTVAQYVAWRPATMKVIGGWVSFGGLRKNGSAGTISGEDGCSQKANVAGVGVPDGMWNSSGGFQPDGTPPVRYMGTQDDMVDEMPIDWAGMVAQTAITPDIIIPGQSYPSARFNSDPNYWPVIYVDGNFSLPSNGRGTLIVTGNMTISGSNKWDGLILVGNALTSNGNNNVQGAVISGLNYLLGQSVNESDAGNGTKTYQYNSCNVESALGRFGSLALVENTWVDNWPW